MEYWVTTTMQCILGIDPGLNITGYGLLHRSDRGPQLDEAGVIRGGSGGELSRRLEKIIIQDYHR